MNIREAGAGYPGLDSRMILIKIAGLPAKVVEIGRKRDGMLSRSGSDLQHFLAVAKFVPQHLEYRCCVFFGRLREGALSHLPARSPAPPATTGCRDTS